MKDNQSPQAQAVGYSDWTQLSKDRPALAKTIEDSIVSGDVAAINANAPVVQIDLSDDQAPRAPVRSSPKPR